MAFAVMTYSFTYLLTYLITYFNSSLSKTGEMRYLSAVWSTSAMVLHGARAGTEWLSRRLTDRDDSTLPTPPPPPPLLLLLQPASQIARLFAFDNSGGAKPGWTIHRPGSALPICFILRVKQSAALAACVIGRRLKKCRQLF